MFKSLNLPIKTVLDTTLFALNLKDLGWYFSKVNGSDCDLSLTIDLSYAANQSECEKANQLTKKGNSAFFETRIKR